MALNTEQNLIVPPEAKGQRLDQFLAQSLIGISRNRIQEGIESGEILCNNKLATQKLKLKGGETLMIQLQETPILEDQPEALPLRIVYEDAAILVLNKQAGLTVHPGAGQTQGTLMNALLHHDANLRLLPRAGIVHRLDKDTTGLMVVAKTESARLQLIGGLKAHQVERRYIALVQGELISGLKIDAPMGRHPVDRKKMAVLINSNYAKPAVTHVRILKKFKGLTLIEAQLETGRTHQIRVHLAHLGYPLVGDKVYGRRLMLSRVVSESIREKIMTFPRQALQAVRLCFRHPLTQATLSFTIEAEPDIADLLNMLETDIVV